MQSLVLAALLVCVPAWSAGDVVTVTPGDGTVDGSIIGPYQNRWKLVGRGSDGSVKEMGTWSDSVQVIAMDGKPVLRRRQVWTHADGTESYFNLVDQKTLTPILSHYTNTPGVYWRFDYRGGEVEYQRSPIDAITGPMTQGKILPSSPVFDFNGGMFGLLIAGFPLAEGYSARFPVFPTFQPDAEPAWVDFRVEGKELVPAGPGKEVEAWKVIVNSPATNEVMRFALIREAPFILRLQQEWQGRDWTFEMI